MEIAVEIDYLGRFTLDDNSHLWDPALPQFVLEYRMKPRGLLPQAERRAGIDKGWNRVTPQELVAILQSAGAIKRM